MISLGIAAAIGAAIGAVALGAASAATHGDVPGLAIALQHIPPTTHGYEVVTAVKNALAGGAGGGGIGPGANGRSHDRTPGTATSPHPPFSWKKKNKERASGGQPSSYSPSRLSSSPATAS